MIFLGGANTTCSLIIMYKKKVVFRPLMLKIVSLQIFRALN